LSTQKTIGTNNESSLHRALKYQYAGPGGKTEAEVGSFVADGIRKDGEYIEVQTGSFGPLKKKVKQFAALGKVRIIHPVAVTKTIEVMAKNGKLLYRRKSPVHGTQWDIFDALLYAPEIALIRGVTIEIALVDITEKRIKDGKGAWRRKGISIHDKELSAFHESILLSKPKDYLRFIPFNKTEHFTVLTHSEKAGVKRWVSQRALYALTKMNLIKRVGKNGNAWIYARS